MVYGDEKRRDSSGCCNRLLLNYESDVCAFGARADIHLIRILPRRILPHNWRLQ